ncbi:MAG: hypothetical protein J3K34DRAFT_466584 [Monoraphidium minutum]|nr:MAG: hypothetical protein J3K34DRAFT_466584 [Monoraphidium minutum]
MLEPHHALAAVFFGLGGWALLAPSNVLNTVLLRPEVTDTTVLLVACVGAQAALTGTLLLTARMTPAAYKARARAAAAAAAAADGGATSPRAFAVGMLPFFVLFNYRYLYVKPMFNAWMWLDVAGSAAIVAACLWGLRRGERGGGGKGRKAG